MGQLNILSHFASGSPDVQPKRGGTDSEECRAAPDLLAVIHSLPIGVCYLCLCYVPKQLMAINEQLASLSQ